MTLDASSAKMGESLSAEPTISVAGSFIHGHRKNFHANGKTEAKLEYSSWQLA
jgi:hypothetical protein